MQLVMMWTLLFVLLWVLLLPVHHSWCDVGDPALLTSLLAMHSVLSLEWPLVRRLMPLSVLLLMPQLANHASRDALVAPLALPLGVGVLMLTILQMAL